MFSITLALGNQAWRLLYKNEEKAALAFGKLQSARQEELFLDDEFGQTVQICKNGLTGFLFEDLEKMKMAHVEMALHNARLQSMANKAAQADPGLRANAMMNGPGVLTPMNGFRPS